MILVILFLTLTSTAVTADPPPPGCEIVDHAGGYVCPMTEDAIRAHKEWQKSLPTMGVLIETYGEPSTCENSSFVEVDCSLIGRDVQVEDRMLMRGNLKSDSPKCEVIAIWEDYTIWWDKFDCSAN